MMHVSVPDVSIIVPTYGRRPDQLRACLDGIARLDGSGKLEVIVVHDGGGDELKPVVASVRDRVPLRLLTQPHRGPGAARNTGAAVARGRWLAFIDDDCIPGPTWLSAFARAREAHPDRLLGGPVHNGLPDDPFATSTQLIATYVTEHLFFTTNNLALSADRFRELGGFDTTIPSATAEDKEFCDRWRARGYQMAWVAEAVVHHFHHLSLWRFLRQHYNYGRGLLHFHRMRRGRGGRGLVPEPLTFYLDLLRYPLNERAPRRGWRYVFLLLLAQVATGAGTLRALGERLRRTGVPSRAGRSEDRAGA
jgi:glycosyltransferase involved in cell wall biosynthesis